MSSLKVEPVSLADMFDIMGAWSGVDLVAIVERHTPIRLPDTRVVVGKIGVMPPTLHNKHLDFVFLREGYYAPHVHKHTSATIMVVAGEGNVTIGGEKRRYKKGDCIYVPTGVPHGFTVEVATMMLSFLDEPIMDPTGGVNHDYHKPEEV